MDPFDKNDDELLGWLEEKGAIIWDGMDQEGEAVFRFDLSKLKDLVPELYAEIMADIDSDLMKLYEAGIVEIEYDEELNATIELTEEGHKIAKDMGIIPIDMDEDDIPND